MQSKNDSVEYKKTSNDIFKFVRFFLYALVIVFFFTFQRVPESLVYFFTGTRPIYLVPIALSISTLEERRAGVLFSLLAGVMIDVDSSYKLGFYTILLPIISVILNNILNKRLLMNSFTSVSLIFVSVLIVCLLELILFLIFTGRGAGSFNFVVFYLKRLFYTSVSVPFFYFFNKSIFLFFRKEAVR